MSLIFLSTLSSLSVGLGGILLNARQFVEDGIARAIQVIHALYEGIGMPLNGRQAGVVLIDAILRRGGDPLAHSLALGISREIIFKAIGQTLIDRVELFSDLIEFSGKSIHRTDHGVDAL